MKLNGWYRIGIVLSFLWCLVIIGITIYQYNNPRNSFFITLEPDITKPILPEAPRVEAPVAQDTVVYVPPPPPIYDTKPVVNYGNVFLSMIITVALWWMIIWSIKWVIRGFKNKESGLH
jgi:hypothetical protein